MEDSSLLKNLLNKYGRCINTFGVKSYPPIICKDGYFMNIQASKFHMCNPKDTLERFEYETVEVRCSEENISELEDFKYSNGLYSNVPIEIIDNIIIRHGGIDEYEINKLI